MTMTIMPEARQRYYNNDGTVAAGCFLWTYAAGTSTLKTAYRDSAGTQPWTNPIELDDKGEAVIFWSGAYKVDLLTPLGVQVTGYPVDNITAPLIPADLSITAGAGLIGFDSGTVYPVGTVGRWLTGLATSIGSSLLGFIQNLVGAVATTAETKMRERVSLLDFMDVNLRAVVKSGGYDASSRAAMLVACNAAWTSAIATPHDLYAPAGRYELGDANFPFRQSVVVSLLDCRDITICGDGPATVFATVSVDGADVFQLNGLKNLTIANLKITASLTATAGSGSNGISVTNGTDNVTIRDVLIENCQSVDKTTYVDGGKGLTIQSGAAVLEVGRVKAINLYVKQCYQGFGFEGDLVNCLTKKVSMDIEVTAEDCFSAVSIGAGAAASAIPSGTHTGLRIRSQSINCQKDVQLARAHGVEVVSQIITTKTEAARRLDPRGSFWSGTDLLVEAFQCTYAHNSQVSISGNKGTCAYKARIGGVAAGSSGLLGATQYCNLFLDIAGTASVVNVLPVDFGGNIMSDSRLEITSTTSSTLHADFYTASRNNTIVIGPAYRYRTPTLSGKVTLAFGVDGTTESASLDMASNVFKIQSKGNAVAGALVAGLYDNSGTLRLGINNGNGIVVDGLTSSAAIGAYVAKQAVYSPSGVLLGYFPVYA